MAPRDLLLPLVTESFEKPRFADFDDDFPPPEAEASPGDLARALFRKSRGDEG